MRLSPAARRLMERVIEHALLLCAGLSIVVTAGIVLVLAYETVEFLREVNSGGGEATGGRVVVMADPSQCLLLYPLPEWEPIEKKLNGLSDFNPRTRSLKQLLVGYAHDMDMDSAGRVLLPPMLRKFADLDKNVVLVGQGSKIELWNEARWEAQVAQALTPRPSNFSSPGMDR